MHPGHHAHTTPGKPAVIMAATGQTISYKQLDDGANRLARLLHSYGLREGDHIAILAENHPRYMEVYWAALSSGLYLTTVNRYLSAQEAAYLVNDSGARVLITTSALAGTAAAMLEMIDGCPRRLMLDGTIAGFEPYERATATMPAEPLDYQPRGDVMLYSSGTTGRPKGIRRPLPGVSITEAAQSGVAIFINLLCGIDEHSVYLSPAPMYHSAPLMWSGAVHELGGTVVVMETFDAARLLAHVERYSVTDIQLVPTMMVRLLKLPEAVRARHDLSSLKMAMHAAAPCPVEVKERMIEWWGPIINEYYAGTEGNGLCFIDSQQWLSHKGSVGKAMLGVVRICDRSGRELGPGEPGLVYFERDVAPFEYHGDSDSTRRSRHPRYDNWSTMGDIGYTDSEGYLYLTDRSAFMIISGGVNIYPREVEDCFTMHPKVADVAVFGLPDPEMGEYVHAVIQLEQGVPPDDALTKELQEYARARIANYKVPRVIDFRPELPRLPTGKLYKNPLRQQYLDRRL